MNTKVFAVDHQTGKRFDAAGMFNAGIKSVRVPVLLANDQGWHELGLPSDGYDLISSGVENSEVLLQYAQLRASWRVDDESYARFLRDQIKLSEREGKTEADLIEEDEYPYTEDEIEAWLARRKQEGLKIDPKTAEVRVESGFFLNPYGVYRDLEEGEQYGGKLYFARRPGSPIWVFFRDLPEVTRGKLWQKIWNDADLSDDAEAEPPEQSVLS